ncbi:imidazolonepropionase [Vibrio penaeicida]|uniref:Imidazolonepropionase n=1 Tax=Vibrio penaeicida TaxID=104609 RepID=A0AAV5NTH0_9VIBR|nr:imidazolonepropionase [Vibrio penaeicida]RTZ21794.1 imidazolonepropionase [Vibrio penaeicida]GLQ73730.1 imidazolonepropionase [Vibrio penaeicida]
MLRKLINARLVTMVAGTQGYTVSPSTSVLIRDGKIDAIGDSISAQVPESDTIDCQNKLVTPGLIDCHTHLVYAGNRANEFEMRLTGVPYEEIAKQGGGILSTVKATRAASIEELVELSRPRMEALLNSGVTAIEIKSGYGLTLDDELKMLRAAKLLGEQYDVHVETTLLAAHAVPPEYRDNPDAYIDLVCNQIIPAAATEGLVSAVDVFCESIGFSLAQTERVFKSAKKHGLKVKGHTEQLCNLGGSALAAQHGALSVDHIEYLDEAGVKAVANAGCIATLLPGAFYFLRETQKPPIDLLRQHHVPMAVSTDINPGTSPFASLTLMMNMACTLFNLTPEETLRGVTVNAAQALGLQDRKGKIQVGYDADFAVWNIEHPADLSYQVGIQHLHARIVNGEWIHV